MLAVSFVAILAGTIAAVWSTRDQQLNFGAEVFVCAVDPRPAAAFKCECARRIEASGKNSEAQRICRERGLRLMRRDVVARELQPVRALAQSDFHRFGFCVFDFPAVAQDAPDHPERTDADCRRAMNERGTI